MELVCSTWVNVNAVAAYWKLQMCTDVTEITVCCCIDSTTAGSEELYQWGTIPYVTLLEFCVEKCTAVHQCQGKDMHLAISERYTDGLIDGWEFQQPKYKYIQANY